MITLHSFVGVDSHVVAIPLFIKFLRFYRDTGVTHFVLDLHTNSGDYARVEAFASIAHEHGATVRAIVNAPYESKRNHVDHVNTFMRDFGSDQKWCVLADCDEFIQFPPNAVTFLAGCDRGGRNLVIGRLLDRISVNSPFPEIVLDSSLDDLFPWAYPLTRHVRVGWDRKVVAFKGAFTCIEGRHGIVQESGGDAARRERKFMDISDRLRPRLLRRLVQLAYPRLIETRSPGVRRWMGRLDVHHFAWDSIVVTKMTARLNEPGATYSQEVLNMLEFTGLPNPMQVLRRDLLKRARLGA